MRDYTEEERQATGLTNEKLYSSAGAGNWRVLEDGLRGRVDPALHEEMMALADAYREAAVPYAYDAIDDNLAQERYLLGRLEPLLKLETLDEDVRASFEYLKHHAQMWESGEASKLVERKMDRENDTAKRLALRARQQEADPPEGDEPERDERRH
jgi:hypothetical protein